MKFKIKRYRWAKDRYEGKKNGFIFVYSKHNDDFYVVVSHYKYDIRYNTLWDSITFKTTDEVIYWCENFTPNNFNCLGNGVDKLNYNETNS